MKKYFFIFLSLFFVLGIAQTARAEEYYYDSIEVEIKVNSDSTFEVSEKQTYFLNGSFGYFYRDIGLKRLDHISDVIVFDSQGRKLDRDEHDIFYKGERLNIKWDFPRRNFDRELKSWTVKYKVHGGLGFYDKHEELYWNAIFADREAIVASAKITVILPQETEIIDQLMFVGPEGEQRKDGNGLVSKSICILLKGSG